MKLKYFGLLFFLILFSCSKEKISETTIKPKVILIQPFKYLSQKDLKEVVENIRKIYPEIRVLEPIDFPENSYYAPRNRYRADSTIKYLNSKTANGFITLGLTSKDISVAKGKNPDYGIMGLGFKPGKACVASKFRLDKKNNEQFYKVAIHELGHTEGLNHCPIKTCFMRDAEGGNPTNEETDFCEKCKNYLKTKNWKFN